MVSAPDGPAILHVLDTVPGEPCPNCGCRGWIVDGDGEGRFWLLCLAANAKPDCTETRPLPDGTSVE